jgi:diphthamide biosynthesis methyltransferase
MLYLVGLGLWDEKDISLKGLEACRKADSIYCELYTAAWNGDLEVLGKTTGKRVKEVQRQFVE